MARATIHLRVLPMTRGECVGGARPCPLTSCRYHLLLEVAEDGRLFKSQSFDEDDVASILAALASMPETCALDVAARGSHTLEEVANVMGMKLQSVDAMANRALSRLEENNDRDDFEDPEHPEDFYIRYTDMGADELAELSAELRRKAKR